MSKTNTNLSKTNKSKYLSSSSSGESVASSSESDDSSSSNEEQKRNKKPSLGQQAKKSAVLEETASKKPLKETHASPAKKGPMPMQKQLSATKGMSVNDAVQFHNYMDEYARIEREHYEQQSNMGLGLV